MDGPVSVDDGRIIYGRKPVEELPEADWIIINRSILDSDPVIGMADRLNLDEWMVEGGLARVWSWANRQCADGFVRLRKPDLIDGLLRRPGFAKAMEEVGLLVVTEDGVQFPNFDEFSPRKQLTKE